MPRLGGSERFWKEKLANPASTDADKAMAAEKLEQIKRRHTREKIAKQRARNRKPLADDDPEPKHDPLCGMAYCVDGCKHIAWYNRQPERPTTVIEEPAPVKIEQPKPVPVVAAPVVRRPAPVKPAPAPVERALREGYSGKFYREVFYDLSLFERNAILRNLNPGQQAEWNTIVELTTMPPAQPVRVVLTEEQKRNVSTSPMVRHDVFDAGKPQTVDEVRETYGPTMGNATPDSGISPELDRRGWLPGPESAKLTPSR
jgi:hypothetical protein